MAKRKESPTWLLAFAFLFVLVAGLALILGQQIYGYSGLAFEVFAYGLSIVALTLAALSAVSSWRQFRIMKKMVRDVHKAVAEIEDVSATNESIRRKLGEDYRMNQAIAEALAEHGVGENSDIREKIARKVARRLKKSKR